MKVNLTPSFDTTICEKFVKEKVEVFKGEYVESNIFAKYEM